MINDECIRYSFYGEVNRDEAISRIESVSPLFKLDEEEPDYVFSFGGDGMMLSAVGKYTERLDDVTFIGIKTGTLGFYTDFIPNELEHVCQIILEGGFRINRYSLLSYTIDADTIKEGLVLNDLAVTNPIRTAILDIAINEKHFETLRGTGLLASTPTGSTAYNKSLGGAVIASSIRTFCLTEIAPISNKIYPALGSSLLLAETDKVAIIPRGTDHLYLSADGVLLECPNVRKITLRLSEKVASFLGSGDYDYFDRVKNAFLAK